MFNLLSSKKQRQTIIENFSQPTHEIPLIKLKEISQTLKITFHTFYSSNASCGDRINFLIQKVSDQKGQNNTIKLAFFSSEQQACCLTVAAANILCSWMEKKKLELVKEEINQAERMLQSKNYQLINCPQMKVFADLPDNFPYRVECVNLILRGIRKILN